MINGADRRPGAFLLTYAVANTGGVIGFLPLLTLLLPLKVEGVAGAERLNVLAAAAIAGAIAASGANILFGWLSDVGLSRGIGRRTWVSGGLIGTAIAYAGIALANTPAMIVLSVVVFQVALNAMLASLFAIMADEIPDAQKGVAGGLLAFANPAAAAVAALVAASSTGESGRLAFVITACALCLAPLLILRARPMINVGRVDARQQMLRRDLWATWAARLLVQISSVVLQFYLLYYFESIAHDIAPAALPGRVSRLLLMTFILPLPVALAVGPMSDRLDRRKPFLLAAALIGAAGLIGMARARGWEEGALAYAIYAVGAGVFLPLQSAFSMQLLPDPRYRGRDLGLVNLANTLPSLVGPLLIWRFATQSDFASVLFALAILMGFGGIVVLTVRGRR